MKTTAKIAIEQHPEFILLRQENQQTQQENVLLKEELANLKRLIFGRKSEKRTAEDYHQPNLFGLEAPEEEYEEQEIAAHTRKKKKAGNKKHPNRTDLPAHLPRKEEVLEPEDKPEYAKKIGEEVSERLAYNPANFFVIRTIRPKYVDVNEQKEQRKDGVFMAAMPSLPLPKSKVDSSLLAHVLIGKFADHLPLHRQLQQMKRRDIIIASSTMNDWFMNSCKLLSPLYEVLKGKLLHADYLQADETPIKVQIKSGKGVSKKSGTHQGYHWVYYDVKNKLVCFDYRKSRSRAGPIEFLTPKSKNGQKSATSFKGTLQCDGYTVYDLFEIDEDITLIGCMAHVRRKFFDARQNDKSRADKVLDWIGQLYKWEKMYKEETYHSDQIKTHRCQHHQPILDQIEQYCQEEINKVIPKSSIYKAMGYAIRQWKKVSRYTQDGERLIDNNKIENTIRPVALGRKNYLFAGSHKGAEHAAMIYSFMATCKLIDVEPYGWLKSVLDQIADYPVNKLVELLPKKEEL